MRCEIAAIFGDEVIVANLDATQNKIVAQGVEDEQVERVEGKAETK